MKILTFFIFKQLQTSISYEHHQAYKMPPKKTYFMSLQSLFHGMSYHLTITCQFYDLYITLKVC
jgi:hypothetical protein